MLIRYPAKSIHMTAIVIGSFIVFSAFCAIAIRMLIPQPKLAAIIAAVASSALLQVGTAIHLGYFDPFWPFAFGGGVVVAWIVATVVIYFFDQRRGKAG